MAFFDPIQQKIDLNFSRPNLSKLYTVRGDTMCRQVRVSLYNGSQPVLISDENGKTFNNAIIMYQREDGFKDWFYFKDGYSADIEPPEPSGNSLSFVLQTGMTSVAGTVKVWLMLTRSTTTASADDPGDAARTFPFELVVSECPWINPEGD